MTREEMIGALGSQVRAEGMTGVAARLKISLPYLWMVLNGRRNPGPKLLSALGLEVVAVTTYRKKTSKREKSGEKTEGKETSYGGNNRRVA